MIKYKNSFGENISDDYDYNSSNNISNNPKTQSNPTNPTNLSFQKTTFTLINKKVVSTLIGKKIAVKSSQNSVYIYLPDTKANSFLYTKIPAKTIIGIATGNIANVGNTVYCEVTGKISGKVYKIWVDSYKVDASDTTTVTPATTTTDNVMIPVTETPETLPVEPVDNNSGSGKAKKVIKIVGGIVAFFGTAYLVNRFLLKPKKQKSNAKA